MKLSMLIPAGGEVYQNSWRALAFDWAQRRARQLFPDAELIIGHNNDQPFNRSAARNHAFEHATGDVLVVADADTIFHPTQIDAAVQLIADGAPWVLPHGYERHYSLTPKATRQVLAAGPTVTITEPSDPDDWEQAVTSWGSVLVVSRTAWEQVGGYDERFRHWGGEDNAFAAAVDRLVGHHVRTNDFVLHLWHPRGDATFDNPGWPANEALLNRYKAAASVEEMASVRCGTSR